jgi:hypothetical protein
VLPQSGDPAMRRASRKCRVWQAGVRTGTMVPITNRGYRRPKHDTIKKCSSATGRNSPSNATSRKLSQTFPALHSLADAHPPFSVAAKGAPHLERAKSSSA